MPKAEPNQLRNARRRSDKPCSSSSVGPILVCAGVACCKSWLSSTIRAEQGFSIPTGLWKQAREHIEARRNQGDKRESLMDELLDNDSANLDPAFQGTKLANFVGALMQAAAETSALTMRTSILFLATHTWVQEKAQKELDQVCGTERMPTFADFKNLPYINCIMKEGLRIRPV